MGPLARNAVVLAHLFLAAIVALVRPVPLADVPVSEIALLVPDEGVLVSPEPVAVVTPPSSPLPAPPPSLPSTWVRVRAKVTAYCPCASCCAGSADGKTATGSRVREVPHNVAADLRLLPPGTPIRVPGYRPSVRRPEGATWEVDDTGSAMRKSAARSILHLDLRFIRHSSARNWGTRWLDVDVDTAYMTRRQVASLARYIR